MYISSKSTITIQISQLHASFLSIYTQQLRQSSVCVEIFESILDLYWILKQTINENAKKSNYFFQIENQLKSPFKAAVKYSLESVIIRVTTEPIQNDQKR